MQKGVTGIEGKIGGVGIVRIKVSSQWWRTSNGNSRDGSTQTYEWKSKTKATANSKRSWVRSIKSERGEPFSSK